MSQRARELEIDTIDLHDKKFAVWLTNLEKWAIDADGKLQALAIKQRGAQRAAAVRERTGDSSELRLAAEGRDLPDTGGPP